jgi:hypothetical protein
MGKNSGQGTTPSAHNVLTLASSLLYRKTKGDIKKLLIKPLKNVIATHIDTIPALAWEKVRRTGRHQNGGLTGVITPSLTK